MLAIEWTTSPWNALNIDALYELISLRQKVFVVEQRCFYQDADGVDQQAIHIAGRMTEGGMVAYCRLYPKADGWHIGRVLVDQPFRGQGLARQVMLRALQQCVVENETYPTIHGLPIHLSAQCHLTHFYQSLGFQSVGEPYVEDGIPHQDMSRAPAFRTTEGGNYE